MAYELATGKIVRMVNSVWHANGSSAESHHNSSDSGELRVEYALGIMLIHNVIMWIEYDVDSVLPQMHITARKKIISSAVA